MLLHCLVMTECLLLLLLLLLLLSVCRDDVYQSSLLGTFRVTQAVWPIMRDHKYGRILNCVSGAGFYGNFGQVNYAAMKMGLVGFTVALNREGPLTDLSCRDQRDCC